MTEWKRHEGPPLVIQNSRRQMPPPVIQNEPQASEGSHFQPVIPRTEGMDDLKARIREKREKEILRFNSDPL